MNAVCERGEWEAMERARPGYHTLVQTGIFNEGEAEKLARGRQADSGLAGKERKSRGETEIGIFQARIDQS